MQSKEKERKKVKTGHIFSSFFSRSQSALSAACRSVFIFLSPPCPQSLFNSNMARRRAEEVLELGTSLEGEGGPKKKVKRRIFSPSFLLGHFYSGRRQEGKECVFVGRMGGVARCPFPEEEEEKGSGVFSSDVTTTPSYTSSSPRRGLLRRSCSSASNSVFYFPVCEEDMDRSVKKISRHISFKEV